jgi:hypothetical protein
MMATIVWTTLAVGAIVGLFAACAIVVTACVRALEGVLARRRGT